MQRVISKILIDKDKYFKILNIVNGQVSYINIYKEIGDSFCEILASEVDNKVGATLISNKNDIPVTLDESKYLLEKIDEITNKSKDNISEFLEKSYEMETSVKLISSFMGITYCVVEFKGKPFYEVFQVNLNEKGEIKGFGLITYGNIEVILSDIATKISLYKKTKFIQIDNDNFYGIKEVKGTIVLAHLVITDTELYCRKAYGIKKIGKSYRFYRHDEVTEKLTDKIENIGSDIVKELAKVIEDTMIKALDEYGD